MGKFNSINSYDFKLDLPKRNALWRMKRPDPIKTIETNECEWMETTMAAIILKFEGEKKVQPVRQLLTNLIDLTTFGDWLPVVSFIVVLHYGRQVALIACTSPEKWINEWNISSQLVRSN